MKDKDLRQQCVLREESSCFCKQHSSMYIFPINILKELEERRNKNAGTFASPQQRCESALSQRSSHSLYSPARLNDLRNAPGPRSASLEMILEPLIQSTQ